MPFLFSDFLWESGGAASTITGRMEQYQDIKKHLEK